MEFTNSPLEPFGTTILDMNIPTQLSYKTPLVLRIVKALSANGCLPWVGSHRAELCCDEAITNAMMHGNQLDPNKNIHVIVCADDEKWGVIVEDEGEGFSEDKVPDASKEDFTFRESGRGILLMDSYMDELKYNRAGNRLYMTRHRQAEPEEAEAQAVLEMDAEETTDKGPVTITSVDGVELVEVFQARIEQDTIEPVRETFKRIGESSALVCLDLSRVEYISSIGLGVLISLYKQIRGKKGHLIVCGVQAGVDDILDSAQLKQLFQFEADCSAALDKLQKLN